MKYDQAVNILGLSSTKKIGVQELKTRFRKMLKENHPDLVPSNDLPAKEKAHEETIRITSAYKTVLPFVIDDRNEGGELRSLKDYVDSLQMEKDIFSVYDTCPICKGERVLTRPFGGFTSCKECGGKGELTKKCDKCDNGYYTHHTVPCHSCKESPGKFTLRSGRIVDCKKCNGTGKVKIKLKTPTLCKNCRGLGKNFQKCPTCRGKGEVFTRKPINEICYKCNGYGEIKLEPFNTVLKPGAILKTR